jgi:protein-disulfide isomerase
VTHITPNVADRAISSTGEPFLLACAEHERAESEAAHDHHDHDHGHSEPPETAPAAETVEPKSAEQLFAEAITPAQRAALNDTKGGLVLGSTDPNAITITTFMDFNCGHCKQEIPVLLELLKSDKNVRIIIKQYPFLTQGSTDGGPLPQISIRNKQPSFLKA